MQVHTMLAQDRLQGKDNTLTITGAFNLDMAWALYGVHLQEHGIVVAGIHRAPTDAATSQFGFIPLKRHGESVLISSC
jgi:hypothetical protein